MAGLEEPYREVVILRFFAELSLAEIAVQADRPLGTVKTHLHRGLQRLRRSPRVGRGGLMGERWTRPDRFRPDELDDDATAGEQARAMATARELEWLAATDDVAPSAGFADRVMAAVAAEPTPRPVAAAASAARRGAILGVLAAFGDLWRVAWTGGRPMAVRAPAMALVVVVMAATLGAGALGVGALGGLAGSARRDGAADARSRPRARS